MLRALALALGFVLFLLTYVPGCEFVQPVIRSQYTGSSVPTPRSSRAPVEVFLSGTEPDRGYVMLGTVYVQAKSRNTSLSNLMHHAKREARRMGGTAIVDVRFQQWTRVSRTALDSTAVQRGTLTGTVVRWRTGWARNP